MKPANRQGWPDQERYEAPRIGSVRAEIWSSSSAPPVPNESNDSNGMGLAISTLRTAPEDAFQTSTVVGLIHEEAHQCAIRRSSRATARAPAQPETPSTWASVHRAPLPRRQMADRKSVV